MTVFFKNKKFSNWIAGLYGIKKNVRVQKALDETVVGKGMNTESCIIMISPNADANVKRLQVLLGSKKAGNNAKSFNEYSAILDNLLRMKKINTRMYKVFIDNWNETDSDDD